MQFLFLRFLRAHVVFLLTSMILFTIGCEDDNHDHDYDHDEGVHAATRLAVTPSQVFAQCEYIQLAIHREESVTHRKQPRDGGKLKMALSKADTESDPHHPDQVVCRHVGAENRSRHTPPASSLSRQIKIRDCLLAPPGP